jgi:hypothetical protein
MYIRTFERGRDGAWESGTYRQLACMHLSSKSISHDKLIPGLTIGHKVIIYTEESTKCSSIIQICDVSILRR